MYMNPHLPNDRQDAGNEPLETNDLHEIAGLTCVGAETNEDGVVEREWIGPKSAWEKYEMLESADPKDLDNLISTIDSKVW